MDQLQQQQQQRQLEQQQQQQQMMIVNDKADVASKPPMGWRSWNVYEGNINQTLMEQAMDSIVAVRNRNRRNRNRSRSSVGDNITTTNGQDEGQSISLCDVGYCSVGLDDNWQDCDNKHHHGNDPPPDLAPNMHYHDINGRSIINLDKFPNMRSMTDYGHVLDERIQVGWYMNNCICPDDCDGQRRKQGLFGTFPASDRSRVIDNAASAASASASVSAAVTNDTTTTTTSSFTSSSPFNSPVCETQIRQDAYDTVVTYNFDEIKLDGCGGQLDLKLWYKYLEESSSNDSDDNDELNKRIKKKRIMIENCHWGLEVPQIDDRIGSCQHYHMYRTTGDLKPDYPSVMWALSTSKHYHTHNLSYPGCWAYLDMLQVGVGHQYGSPAEGTKHYEGLSMAETRSHFGSWAIVSSPMILSFDISNNTLVDMFWDIIANEDVIDINQRYVGDSGGVFLQSSKTVLVGRVRGWQVYPGRKSTPLHKKYIKVVVPQWQFLAKTLDPNGQRIAVLMMNSATKSTEFTLDFNTVPGLQCHSNSNSNDQQQPQFDNDPPKRSSSNNLCLVYNVWTHETIGIFDSKWTVTVEPHDAAMIILSTPSESELSSYSPIHEASDYRGSGGVVVRHKLGGSIFAFVVLAMTTFVLRRRRARRRILQLHQARVDDTYNRISMSSSFGFDDEYDDGNNDDDDDDSNDDDDGYQRGLELRTKNK